MRTETIEVYSDATNAAILRHPSRRFPGVLIQGDTLWTMYKRAEMALLEVKSGKSEINIVDLEDLTEGLAGLVKHYKVVLGEHNIQLPFSDQP